MAQVATARMSLGAVFGTIGTAANAVSSTLDTAVQAVSMLDQHVKAAATRQSKRITADMAVFDHNLALEKGQELAERQIAADEYCNKSERHAELFNVNYQKILAAINAPKK